ncbi:MULTISPECIES: DUF5994 family protein [Amycolatopsis]|uniref:Uncharacterized protein n=1 Tax=Amycolatopsis rubida TaxID=112413 RepID=A0A1I6BE66_9PSEU|nr:MULTISPECIES: DUF5994 family protein [Amycolatopsis]OAP29169.1 hypothetical protein A4R44_00964 [Amycolatopsis sp. M39]SFQ79201.1 hypothetical protein SAMN05421854_1269 [Amycolatopsis rubida]
MPTPPRRGRSSAPAEARLRLKPPLPVAGFVDGGWWPASADLTAEVPGLAAALADRIGPVWRVAFAPQAWLPAEPTMISRGRLVRLEGFRSQDPHVVHVTGGSMRRLTLLVVPARTPPAAAATALSAAADRNGTTRPEAILKESGAAPRPAEDDVCRWESEGGAGFGSPAPASGSA